MLLHKRLFLEYLSGDWVLCSLVADFNLAQAKRASGVFQKAGRLTVRGAAAAISGLLSKIANEPELCQQLRESKTAGGPALSPEWALECELGLPDLLQI